MNLRSLRLPRLGLILSASLLLAACGQDAPAPAAPAQSGAGPAAATDSGTAAARPERRERTPGPVVPPQGPPPVAGTDYVEIPTGQPFKPGNPNIEVVEVFGYTCPACAMFEPVLSAWADRLPADVEFIPVPAPFGGYWLPYAKAYYAAEGEGIAEQSHDAMFDAFHVRRTLNPNSSESEIAAFYGQFGVDPEAFARSMSSFAVNSKLSRARQFLQRSGVDATPTLVIDGRYRVVGGDTWDEKLRIADHLIAMRREARGGDAAATGAAAGEAEAAGGATTQPADAASGENAGGSPGEPSPDGEPQP